MLITKAKCKRADNAVLTCLIHEFNFEEFSGVSCEAVVCYCEQLIT